MKSPVSLYIRVRSPKSGDWVYVQPARTSKGLLRPLYARLDGRAVLCPEGTYNLRFRVGKRRVWQPVGNDPTVATVALQRKQLELAGGKSDDPVPAIPESVNPVRQPVAADKGESRPLIDCMRVYIRETAEQKSKRTLYAYSETLIGFLESLNQRTTGQERQHTLQQYLDNPDLLSPAARQKHIEGIAREDLLRYMSFLRRRGNAERTVHNRVGFLHIFIKRFDGPWPLRKNDRPRYTEKVVRSYNPGELQKMFDAATTDEADLLHFLLGTGTREQEAQFACWPDVDLVAKTYTVTEHLDLGYRPKDREEGTLHIPDVLVERLIARRARFSKSRLIFPRSDGQPNGHLLRIVKGLALRANVNCGHCANKAGQSCADHAVCRHVILHKMRKTYATMLHKNGVPARTIMRYLRHSDLDTTLRYLADAEDDQALERINQAFGCFAQLGGAL